MSIKFKETASYILTFIERLIGISPPKVTVLLFHSVSSDGTLVDIDKNNFAYQLNYLKNNFDFISLDQVIAYIKGDFYPKQPSVALTFDDGYEDILKNVIPLLAKDLIPATFFVVADPNNINRSELRNDKRVLTLKKIKDLKGDLFSIGSHTMTHIDLKNVSLERGVKELNNSKRVLESVLKTKIKYFAYPKGFYTEQIVSKAGKIYHASFGTQPGVINQRSNLQLISRIGVDRTISNPLFPSLFTYWIILYFNLKPKMWEILLLLNRVMKRQPEAVLSINTK